MAEARDGIEDYEASAENTAILDAKQNAAREALELRPRPLAADSGQPRRPRRRPFAPAAG